jgi:YD repeat-containing protein
MSRPQPRSQSDEWRELSDPVRGTRHVRFDGSVLREAWLPTGEHLELAHADDGRLRQVDVDGRPLLHIEPLPGLGRGIRARFIKEGIVSDFRVRGDGRERTLVTRGTRLCFEHDAAGRLQRAVLPGSPSTLEYRWDDASCTIAPAGGPPIAVIEPAGDHAMRVTVAEWNAGWVETLAILGPQTIAIDGFAECRIDVDALHRPTSRSWSDGWTDLWSRDEKGRLDSWTRNGEARTYRYDDAGDLVEEHAGGALWRRETDGGHRVATLFRPDGSRVAYHYDAAGRRIARDAGGVVTTYTYDLFGQLTRAGDARFTYDGLGRRIAVETPRGIVHEHRDSGGRLWAITDGDGRALHTFIWFDGRMIARLDGDSDAAVSEAFVSDGGGSLLAVLAPRGSGVVVERVDAPPFGAVSAALRPTLYGHVGDPQTGLIHFGARELDPELGLFLTPDPWDGAPDDPRLWEGADPATLARAAEIPAITIHPYAVCHFDPVGRTDLDGHYVNGWGILRTVLLAPTWGAPLTAISLLFFMPFNIYFELIGDLIFLITRICGDGWTAPWKRHHIWRLIGGAASARQGVISFGLNGILPRIFAARFDFDASRAITVGNVVWIHPDELNELDGKVVLEVWNISGPPDANGKPTGGATAFSSSATQSVVAVTGTKDGKSRLHVSRWERGFGNAVGLLGITQRFEDHATGVAPGTILLNAAPPDDFPIAEDDDSKETMKVEEYLLDSVVTAQGTVVAVASSIALPASTHPAVNDLLEIASPSAPATAARTVKVTSSTAFTNLPAGAADTASVPFEPPLPPELVGPTDLTVRRFVADTPPLISADWTQAGGASALQHAAEAANWPPPIAANDLFRITSGADTVHAQISKTEVTIDAAPPFGALVPDPNSVTLLQANGGQFNADVDAALPGHLKLTAGHPVVIGDLLRILKGATEIALVRVTASDATGADVTPPLGAVLPDTFQVQRYTDTNPALDKGTITTLTGNQIVVDAPRANLFAIGSYFAYLSGGNRMLRQAAAIPTVKLTLSRPVLGAAPYTLARVKVDPTLDLNGQSVTTTSRLVRWTSGSLPSAFGTYPGAILEIAGRYFVNPAAGLESTPTWGTRDADADHYWTLSDDVGIAGAVTVQQYKKGTAVRPDAGETRRVFAKPAEVLVPEEPTGYHSYRRALIEHELHHSVQGAWWGPIMNALPLSAAFSAFDWDTVNRPKWFEDQQLSVSELASMGGLMELSWKYLFLLPVYFSEEKRKAILSTQFEGWEKYFNPFAALLRSQLPQLKPDDPDHSTWKGLLIRFLFKAFDLRSWTPFTGWVPTLLPDGSGSFLEQQASRASGDLYSPLLSADDKFNFHTTRFFIPDFHDADMAKNLGDSTRMMAWLDDRTGFLFGRRTNQDRATSMSTPFFTITAPADSLFHPDLYSGGAGTIELEGPAPARAAVKFLRTAGETVLPRPRAFVPTPPRVTRSTGFFFIPASPGRFTIDNAGSADPAETDRVTLTIARASVKLGERDVDWVLPAEKGKPTASLPLLDVFITEALQLRVDGSANTDYAADIAPDPSAFTIAADGTSGWTIEAATAVPVPPGTPEARVRLYRIYKADDAAFNLTFDAESTPTLAGKRSYLDDPIWIPLRDFRVTVKDIPPIPNATHKPTEAHDVTIPIAVPTGNIIVTPPPAAPALPFAIAGPPTIPRTQNWRFGPPAGPITAPTTYTITITFGRPGHSVDRTFTVTYQP